MIRLCPASTVAGLGLCALVLTSGCGSERSEAPPPDPDTPVVLRHAFHPQRARRYQCRMRTTHVIRDENATATAAPPGRVTDPWPDFEALLAAPLQQTAGVGVQDIVMVEEEACHRLLSGGRADVSYRCVSCDVATYRDGARVYEYRSDGEAPAPSSAQPVATGTLREMYEPIRYVIDDAMHIESVSLPNSLHYKEKALIESSYKKALQSRYRSFFPDRPVRPGDTWTGKVPLNEGMAPTALALEAVDYEVRAVHAGYQRKLGRWCTVIDLVMRIDADDGTAVRSSTHSALRIDSLQAQSRIWFDHVDGGPVLEESILETDFRREQIDDGTVFASMAVHVEQLIRTVCIDNDRQV